MAEGITDKPVGAIEVQVDELMRRNYPYVKEGLTDCNTIKTTGIYKSYSPSNAPTGVTGWVTMMVLPGPTNTYCGQLLFQTYTSKIYFRTCDNNTFNAWKEL